MKQKNMNLYKAIVGEETVDKIYEKSSRLKDKHIVCISSTYQGGGVAEMLNSMIPMFNDVGMNFGWRILHGTPDFFTITKKFHNSLQGDRVNLSQRKKNIYYETNRRFAKFTHLNHALVVVHDPQPLPLIDFYEKTQPWILRLHIDITKPNNELWEYLKGYMSKYDHVVVSHEDYKKKDLKVPQSIIFPTIDPLTIKNKPITVNTINNYLTKFGVKPDKPIVSQVSRFDKFKDPKGVLKIFEKVRKEVDCQLILLGSLATDDPEGQKIFEDVKKAADKSTFKDDIHLILVDNDILVNAVQSASAVVIQKSLREGFGLVVSEALYKKTPVVASNVGGIPFQVIDGETGFLHDPKDVNGFAGSVIRLLNDGMLREELGTKGHDHVRDNFLITRLMLDWMELFEKYIG